MATTDTVYTDLITSGTLTTSTSNITISPNSNSTLIWDSTAGNVYYGSYDSYTPSNPLSNLYYNVKFGEDPDNLLSSNIKSIKKNKFIFECNYVGNRIQPYEFIMKLIDKNKKFSVNVKVSDILTIKYVNLQFIEIVNNLNFSGNCDFSKLKVKFKCEKILYENHKLSEKELRTEKLKKIIENQ